jgi:hypothetical protein
MSKNKSPHHPSALRIGDIHPGRQVIYFNLSLGILYRATIVSAPRVVLNNVTGVRYLKVKLKTQTRGILECFLSDLGVIPNSSGAWSPTTFLIDARKEHLLPPAAPSSRTWSWDDVPYRGHSGDLSEN